MAMAPVVTTFDVNETLLDLAALDPLFERHLGSAALRPTWFATMLQVAFVGGLTGRYVDFTAAQTAALHMTAARAGTTVSAPTAATIVEAMRHLPPHPDAQPALKRLVDAGVVVTALTNSVADVAEEQLTNAGLRNLFTAVHSADAVQALKPRPEPYAMVAAAQSVDLTDLWLVAAHGWDVSGALAAGAHGAFVARSGAVPIPLGTQPEIVGDGLHQVVDQLLAIQR